MHGKVLVREISMRPHSVCAAGSCSSPLQVATTTATTTTTTTSFHSLHWCWLFLAQPHLSVRGRYSSFHSWSPRSQDSTISLSSLRLPDSHQQFCLLVSFPSHHHVVCKNMSCPGSSSLSLYAYSYRRLRFSPLHGRRNRRKWRMKLVSRRILSRPTFFLSFPPISLTC